MKTTWLNKFKLLLLVLCISLGLFACGSGTETCNPNTTGNSCATASPVVDTDDASTQGTESECTDADDDGLDDTSGEECNTTDAAVSAIVEYILKSGFVPPDP